MSFFKQLLRDIVSAAENRVEVTNPAKVVGNDLINGDTNILQLAIYKDQSAFDIKSQVTEIHIYESIMSPAVFCTMVVADAINLQDDYIINIGSIIRFEFQTPGTSQSNEYFFQVRSVSGKRDVPGLTMKVFSVELVSVEAAAAQNVNMEGFRLTGTSGDLIEKIMEDHVNKHPEVSRLNGIRREQRIDIDSGIGIIARNEQQTRVLARNRKPFEVIHQLALLTNRSPEGDTLYTFFERKDGYQFKPIEKLMRDGKKLLRDDRSDAVFFYDNLRNQDQSAVKFRNILAYNISTSDNLTEGRGVGVNSVAVTTNPQTGDNSTPASAPQDNTLTELTSGQLLRAFDTVTRSENITSTEFTHLNEVLVKRRQIGLRISQYEAQILIYGDTNLTVGNVIECNFPRSISTSRESSDPEGTSELSTDSGYYLITHLRHIILNTDRPQHAISCNLMRAEPARS
jgi:hypothetical protein